MGADGQPVYFGIRAADVWQGSRGHMLGFLGLGARWPIGSLERLHSRVAERGQAARLLESAEQAGQAATDKVEEARWVVEGKKKGAQCWG